MAKEMTKPEILSKAIIRLFSQYRRPLQSCCPHFMQQLCVPMRAVRNILVEFLCNDKADIFDTIVKRMQHRRNSCAFYQTGSVLIGSIQKIGVDAQKLVDLCDFKSEAFDYFFKQVGATFLPLLNIAQTDRRYPS